METNRVLKRMKVMSVKTNLARNIKYKLPVRSILTCQDIKSAISIDEILPLLFQTEAYQEPQSGLNNNPDYEATIKNIIEDEKLYLRQLQMISKVFRDFILMKSKALRICFEDRLEAIFSNINQIITLTMQVILAMEDLLENKEESVHVAADFFEEVAQTMMWDDYVTYAEDILSANFKRTFEDLLYRSDVSDDVKYYLPMLLQEPIYHCFHYHRYLKSLIIATPLQDEKHSLSQVLGMLNDTLYRVITTVMQLPGYFGTIKRTPIDIYHHQFDNQVHRRRKSKPDTINLSEHGGEDTEGSITNIPLDIALDHFSNLIYQGQLLILEKRLKERYVFLFQNLLVITQAHRSVDGGLSSHYGYKDAYFIEKIEIKNREDSDMKVDSERIITKLGGVSAITSKTVSETSLFLHPYNYSSSLTTYQREDLKNTFEIVHSENNKKKEMIFKADSVEEKNAWMAALFMLKSKPVLEEALDAILLKEKNSHPLKLPSVDQYPFSEPDSPQNIVFETKDNNSSTMRGQEFASTFSTRIKGATLMKLVERMTHPAYSSPKMIKEFLITYRSFSNPNELLDLLIKRFNIPKPDWFSGSKDDEEMGMDDASQLQLITDQKRFRNEYVRPVQTIVLNVLKHWLSQHFYDFENDSNLFYKFKIFLEDIETTSLKGKWTDMIRSSIKKKTGPYNHKNIIFSFLGPQPEIEIHLELQSDPDWPYILTYHPNEIARQLTLLDFEYFRSVKPNELVNCSWMNPQTKYEKSPNVMQMMEKFNNLTKYFQKIIVDAENLEERRAIVNRLLEIMVALQDINNFNGMFAITSVLQSASIHRLHKTKEGIRKELSNKLQEVLSLKERHDVKYMERLHQIQPPVVPYFGTYLGRLYMFEEGNPNFLTCTSEQSNGEEPPRLINFFKSSKVAEQISEIQQYQNESYNFKIYPALRKVLESLNPFPEMSNKEMDDYLWERSKIIEPGKDIEPLMAERKWQVLQLTSPVLLDRKIHPRHSARNADGTEPIEIEVSKSEYVNTKSSNSLRSSPKDNVFNDLMPLNNLKSKSWGTMFDNPVYVPIDTATTEPLAKNVPPPRPHKPESKPPKLPPKCTLNRPPIAPPRPPR